jgi:integrase
MASRRNHSNRPHPQVVQHQKGGRGVCTGQSSKPLTAPKSDTTGPQQLIGASITSWRQPIRHDERITRRLIAKLIGHLYPSEVEAKHVQAICDHYRHMVPASRVSAHSRIRHTLALLGCPPNPDGYPIVPTVTPREVTVPDEEFEAVLSIAHPKLRLSLLLARDAALRISAIANLSAHNVDFDANEIVGKTKRYTSYRVQLTTRLKQELAYAVYMAKAGLPLLATFNRNMLPPHPSSISHDLIKAKKQLGITRPWGFHDIRRTAARSLYSFTGDIRKVQSLLGHTSLTSTLWYLGNAGSQPTADELEQVRRSQLS